jgi:hypothetical protein
MIEFYKSNGGSPVYERNDCTVRALAVSTGQPYFECYDTLARFGRKPNKGISVRDFFKRNKTVLGFKFKKLKFKKQITLSKFVKKYPLGVYYVRKTKHVFVVKDGIVIDSCKPKTFCRITDAW